MLEFAVSVIERIGVLGAGLLIALETVIAPLPSEVVLLLTGVNVSEGNFSFLGALLITTTGSLVGASLLYAAGYFLSAERLEHLIARYGKFFGITVGDLRKTLSWLDDTEAPLSCSGGLSRS